MEKSYYWCNQRNKKNYKLNKPCGTHSFEKCWLTCSASTSSEKNSFDKQTGQENLAAAGCKDFIWNGNS